MLSAKPTQEDLDYLAITIWAEARGEGREGMRSVAEVIKNRANDPHQRWGHTVRDVVTKPKQFSCFNPGDPNFRKCNRAYLDGLNPVTPDAAAWREAQGLAMVVLGGHIPELVNQATFYHTKNIHPYWASSMTQVAVVGNHIFYKG